jgi:hypothetical protein
VRKSGKGMESSQPAIARSSCLAALMAFGLVAAAPAYAQAPQTSSTEGAAPAQAQAGATASGQVKPAPPAGADSAARTGGQAESRTNDFTTLARVEYVFECLQDNPGPRHEMVYKCVCAIDRIAEQIPYDRWIDLDTFFKARPMAGERGAYVRERSDIQAQIKSYNQVQARAKKACFIADGK